MGTPVGEGTEVNFNIDGVFYTAKTNEQGIASLDIDFVPGGYVVTAEYYGCMVSNYIRVMPVLYARDLNMIYLDGSQFIATIYDNLEDRWLMILSGFTSMELDIIVLLMKWVRLSSTSIWMKAHMI